LILPVDRLSAERQPYDTYDVRVAHDGRADRPRRTAAPRGERPDRRDSASRDDRLRRPTEPPRPGLARKENEPPIPEGVDIKTLHRAVRAELRGLPKDLAEIVASHLVVAGELIDEDPELAYSHAEAARRRAARLPIVREATAETAYAAGLYDVALSEFRALRRMTGTHDYLPVMADCDRALGRPHNALKLAREADRLELDPALRIEMIIVEAGARADLGQDPEARRILSKAVESVKPSPGLQLPVARLRYALAEALLKAGKQSEARRWFAAAAELDHDQEIDAARRVDELDGFLIDFDEDDGDAR
jgi:tetratricopeptide (TPR) repeat protein